MKNPVLHSWLICCLLAFAIPFSVAAQCGAGESFFTYNNAFVSGQPFVDVVGFEVCPTTGMAAEARIIAGNLFNGAPPNNLKVYQGATGSGTMGTLVFGPANGELSGNTITGTLADECLIFVFSTLPATLPNTPVEVCGSSVVATSSVSLVLSGDSFCTDDAVQTLSGGMPAGGTYSGMGVTDNGNGTFQFDPATAGAGTKTITYTQGGNMATDNILVTAANSVTMNVSLTSRCIDESSLVLPGGGMPQGGVYSGPGVTDLGDGITFRFTPATAGIGTATITYTGPAPCFDVATDQITVDAACTCPEGQDSYFFCQGNDQSNVVAFEVCPSAGFAARATITAGTYGVFAADGDVLNVYSGASGSGASGMVVAANLTGNLSGTVIEGSVADNCLIFVSTTGPVGSCQDGMETGLAACGEDIAPSVSFVDPGDFCVTGGVSTGLTGGMPTGGVYSGPGVTDDDNGSTFSFDPVTAGVGVIELIYTNTAVATVMVEVFDTGVVGFTAPADVCIDAGVQTGLSGGSPAGGTYSGPGVTNNGDGTYNFNPALAGLGVKTISYTDATGCMETATDDIEVLAACGCPMGETSLFSCAGNNEIGLVLFEMCPTAGMAAEVTIGQGTFGADDELTIYEGASGSGTGGTVLVGGLRGNLAGQVYTANNADDCLIFVLNSGPAGSCQDGFELPLEACGRSVLSVSFVALDDISVNAGVQTGLSGGLPTGGVYDGPGVTNDGNGMTYTFDPAVAGVGVRTLTYTFSGITASDDVEVLDLTPPTFAKSFSPTIIAPGSVTTLTFNIDNTGSEPVNNMAFVDNLPAGMTVAFPAVITSTCPGGTITAVEGSGTISLTNGMLGGTTACAISVNVTSSTEGENFNVTGDLTSSSGNSGTAAADLTVDGAAPTFSKSFSPATVNIGEISTLTFTIDNTAGAVDLNGAQFTDNLPTGMVVASSPSVTTSCTGGVVTADPGASTITYQGGFTTTVAAGASCAISVDVISSASGNLNNVTGNLSTRNSSFQTLNSGKASAALTVRVPGDILIQKRFVNNPVSPGETTTLEFTISNLNRDFSATSVAFTDDLTTVLAGLTATGTPINDVCGSGAQLSGTTMLAFTGGTIAPNSSCTFSVPVQVPAGAALGNYTNVTSQVTADINGAAVVGNAATAPLSVTSVPLFTKTFLDDPVVAGGTVDMEISITNTSSSSDLTGISFTDNLDAFISGTTISALPAAGSCGAGSAFSISSAGGELTFQMTDGSIPAGGNCTFTVGIQIPAGNAPGTYTNTTSFLTGTVDGQSVSAPPAQDDLTVLAVPTLTKSFTDDPVNPGDIVNLEFTISYDEFATGDATNISFTDDLNAVIPGLAAVGLPMNDVCGLGAQISGTNNLTFTGGTVSPGDVCTFSVPVEVPAGTLPGFYTNTTSALTATVGGLPATGNSATDDLEIGGLSFTKEFINDPVLPGDLTTLRFTIENTSTFDATDIVFTDNLDSVLPGLVAEAPLPTAPCGAGSDVFGTNFLIFTGGNVTAGNSCSFDVQVRVPANAVSDTYNNVTSNLNATIDGSNRVLPPATDQLVVDNNLIQLSKVFTNDPVLPGGTVTLEYTLTNLDPNNSVSDIAFTDDLDAALAGLVATGLPMSNICNAGSQLSGTGVLSFTGGTLAPGASCTFSVDLQVPPETTPGTLATSTSSSLTGTVNSIAVVGDPATDDLQISGLTFTKAFTGTPLPGGTATLTFTITNEDPDNPVLDIAFTDDLDAALSGLVATALPVNDLCNTGSLLSGTSVITYERGELSPGQSCTFDVTVSVPCDALPGTYTNTTSSLTALSNSTLLTVNPATADLTVTGPVVSFTAPDDLCVNTGVQADLGGGMPAGGTYSGPGVSDDGNGMTYDFDPAAAGAGVRTITYTISNSNACETAASDDIEVLALPTVTFTAPADLCVDAGVQAGLGGGTPTGGVYSGPGVDDDSNGMTYSFDPAAAGPGTHILTYTFTGANGCTNAASDEVEVFALPTVTFTAPAPDVCVDDSPQTGLSGGMPTGGTYSGLGVADDGNGITFTFDPAASAPAGGDIPVTYTFMDGNGCSNAATDDIFVDPVCNEPPVAVCQPVTVNANENCEAEVDPEDFDGGSTDPDGDMLTFSVDPAGPYALGTTNVTLTVSDGTEMSQCTTTVTVEDNTAPDAQCQNVTVQLDANGEGSTTPEAVDNMSTDACGIASLTLDVMDFLCEDVGPNTVTLTVEDVNGNSNTCEATVTVEDNVPPVALCQPVTVQLDANGEGSTTAEAVNNTSTDACGIGGLALDITNFLCEDVGDNTVVLTVMDQNGNSSTCEATVTVEDNVPPVALCQPVTVQLDANGEGSTTAEAVNNTSTDACGIGGLALDVTNFLCEDVGDNTVVLTVMDQNGNSSTCEATVTVEDNVPPVALCQNVTVQLDANGEGSTTAEAVNNTSTDACGIGGLALDVTNFLCEDVGNNTVALTVMDQNGNSSTCEATVTVEDNVPPVALCQNVTVQLDANGEGSTTAEAVNNTSTDACGIGGLELDITNFLCEDVGDNTVVLTVMDQNGNSSTCEATVTVEDNLAPIVTTTDQMIVLNDNNVSQTLVTSDLVTATDNCGEPITIVFDRSLTFDGTDIGTNVLTATVTDANGNVTVVTVTVIVTFDQPNLACIGEINLTLNDECQALIIPRMVLTGNTGLIDAFPFMITVMDSDPSNGPIIDGCGEFTYSISVPTDLEPTFGFRGDYRPSNWTEIIFSFDGGAQTVPTDEQLVEVDFTSAAMVLSTQATVFNTGSEFGVQQGITFTETGTVNFDYDFNGVDAGFDQAFSITTFEGDIVEIQFNANTPTSGTASAAIEPGYSLIIQLRDDGFQPFAPNTDLPSVLTIDNFSFIPPVNPLALDFETCWGIVRAEDKTSPEAETVPDDVELLCVDLDGNNLSTLPASVSKCYRVDGQTGATIPGTMTAALRARLLAGGINPLVPVFTDGCAQQLEVCVSDAVAFGADPSCDDVVITRTFVATEVSTCVSASGEENAPAVASYTLTFERPTLADLNGNSIEAVVNIESCGSDPSVRPAPRSGLGTAQSPNDYPFLQVGDRTFFLENGEAVCNIGVTYSDGPSIVTCPNTYKFVRTYTVIDWCEPSDVRTFTQVVKVGDTTAPTLVGPNVETDPDGTLVYGTNAGNICAAFIRLDDITVTDNCPGAVTVTAEIFPNGNLNGAPIGAFTVVPGGAPELTPAIPAGTHILRYTYSDVCGNTGVTDYDFRVEDQTPPVAICEDGLNVSIAGGANNGFAVLTPANIDNGSYDDCSGVTLEIARVNASNLAIGGYGPQITLTCADIGTVRVGLKVSDALGNMNFCWLDVLVEDKIRPTCVAPGNTTITCVDYNASLPNDITDASFAQLDALFGQAAGVDNCGTTITQTVSGTINSCGVGRITRSFTSTDDAGFTNANVCRQIIDVIGIHDYRITFPTDEEGDCMEIPAFDAVVAEELACDLITTTVDVDTLRTQLSGDECFKLRVTYDVVNWCEYNSLGEPYVIRRDAPGAWDRTRNPRNIDEDLLYVNVTPGLTTATINDDVAFYSLIATDRIFNPAPSPQRDVALGDNGSGDANDDDTYGTNVYDSRGFFRYTQFIKIYDEVAPEITFTEPAECFAGSGEGCRTTVTLEFTATDECSAATVSVMLDANFTGVFAADNAAALGISVSLANDGEGNYTLTATNVPVGAHAIRVRANDGCGNSDVQIIEFCVTADRTPTPICIQTLTVTLMTDGNGGGIAAIWASDFIASPIVDCFGNVVDKYSLYRSNEAGEAGFTPVVGQLGIDDIDCDDLGDLSVRVYAFDDNGSTPDYCEVIVEVQDNMGWCDGSTGNLSGLIATPNAEVIAGVQVSLTSSAGMDATTTTSAAGTYSFTGLALNADYTVQPVFDAAFNAQNVRASDLVAGIGQILGTAPFTSAYQFVAADVNQDASFDVFDILAGQRAILGLDDGFAGGNWFMVEAGSAISMNNPYAVAFPEVFNANDLQGSITADFVAVEKMNLTGATGRVAQTLNVDDAQLESGQLRTIILDGTHTAGFQGTIELAAGLELISADLTGQGGLNLNRAGEGLIAVLLREGGSVSLEVRATTSGLVSELITLSDAVTVREGVALNGTSNELDLAFNADFAPATAQNVLHQNTPNPVRLETVIRFELAAAGAATLTLRDAAGRLVSTQEIDAAAGLNVVELTNIKASGVLSYTLTAGEFTASKKMVVVK